MHMDEANLMNLSGLWKKYGALSLAEDFLPLQYANISWPYRYWFDQTPAYSNSAAWIEKIPESAVIPLWSKPGSTQNLQTKNTSPIEQLLLQQGWYCTFQQMAMYMELRHETANSQATRPGLKVDHVRSLEEMNQWVDIASEAFDYHIDHAVIETLVDDKDIVLLLAWQQEQAVATALLYKTGDIIGIHQVGVKQAFQGQGIARSLMHHILTICAQWRGRYLVLQASDAGQALYDSLGFRSQFLIKNYQRIQAGLHE